jgi:hypothetical protein
VYCFEKTVDPAVRNNYFLSRTPKPIEQWSSSGTPSGWDRDKIRRLWKKNLYGEG